MDQALAQAVKRGNRRLEDFWLDLGTCRIGRLTVTVRPPTFTDPLFPVPSVVIVADDVAVPPAVVVTVETVPSSPPEVSDFGREVNKGPNTWQSQVKRTNLQYGGFFPLVFFFIALKHPIQHPILS